MSRESARESYDAIVDVLPLGGAPTSAYALVKKTYAVGRRDLAPAAAESLYHDLRDPTVMPRLVPGCEFYPFKQQADVVVRGFAFAPRGRPVAARTIALRVGDHVKTIDVLGRRTVSWEGGKPRFSPPEPFVRMSVTWREAYGGVDPRVPFVPGPGGGAHPGVYPRNPLGKGYAVLDAPIELELPNLEDPSHRLTEDSFVVGDASRWHTMPLPWCFEYTLPLMFPRRQWLGSGAALGVSQDAALEEVARGFLQQDWRARAATVDEANPPPIFYQEAPFGQRFERLEPGTPISVEGMNPTREVMYFEAPPTPHVELDVGGRLFEVPAHLGTLLVEPAVGRVSAVWIARLDPLPVALSPNAPRLLPLAVRVDGDEPIAYAPPTSGMDFMDSTAPLPAVPRTKETAAPPARPRFSTLKLTDAQLRGEEPVPMSSPENRATLSDPPLTLEAIGEVVGMEDTDVTDVSPMDSTSPGQGDPTGRHTLVDPEDLV